MPDVSFCMIVRNGAATLPACLESAAPIADEVIVVDTGSTDDSPDVARRFGARVVSVPWPGDFATARNEYLKVARCAWVLSLDADEVLGRVERRGLHAMLTAHPATAFVFTIRNYFFTSDGSWTAAPTTFEGEIVPGVGCTTSRTVRLLPRRPGVRYSYPVHESLLPSLRRHRIALRRCVIPIHHMGYVQTHADTATKATLYKQLGLKKIAQYPRDSRAHLELGRLFLHEGDHARARRLFTRALQLNPLRSDAHYYLALAHLRSGEDRRARQQLQIALQLFPRDADLLYLRSRVEFDLGHQLQAAVWLARAMPRLPHAGAALLRAGALGGSTEGLRDDGAQSAS